MRILGIDPACGSQVTVCHPITSRCARPSSMAADPPQRMLRRSPRASSSSKRSSICSSTSTSPRSAPSSSSYSHYNHPRTAILMATRAASCCSSRPPGTSRRRIRGKPGQAIRDGAWACEQGADAAGNRGQCGSEKRFPVPRMCRRPGGGALLRKKSRVASRRAGVPALKLNPDRWRASFLRSIPGL